MSRPFCSGADDRVERIDVAGHRHRVHGDAGGAREVAGGAGQVERHGDGAGTAADRTVRQLVEAARPRHRRPPRRLRPRRLAPRPARARRRLRRRRVVQHRRHERRAAHAVGERMVRPQVEGGPAAGQPLDQRRVPWRVVGVERSGLEQGDQVEELALVPRRRHGGDPQVVPAVVVRVLDPDRPGAHQGRVVRALLQARRPLGGRREAGFDGGPVGQPVEQHQVADGHPQAAVLPGPPHDRLDRGQTFVHESTVRRQPTGFA